MVMIAVLFFNFFKSHNETYKIIKKKNKKTMFTKTKNNKKGKMRGYPHGPQYMSGCVPNIKC